MSDERLVVEAEAMPVDAVPANEKPTVEKLEVVVRELEDRVSKLDDRRLFLEDARDASMEQAQEVERALAANIEETKQDRLQAQTHAARMREVREASAVSVAVAQARESEAVAKSAEVLAVLRDVKDYILPGARCGLCYEESSHRSGCPMPRVLEALRA